jgi:hypothetical protein
MFNNKINKPKPARSVPSGWKLRRPTRKRADPFSMIRVEGYREFEGFDSFSAEYANRKLLNPMAQVARKKLSIKNIR